MIYDSSKGFQRVFPLTELLIKDHPRLWLAKCKSAFKDLKAAMLKGSILDLVDRIKPFEVEIDASDFALGGIFIQKGHPIAYESRKFNNTKRRYIISEKKMLVVVHYLRTWRQYLLGSRFLIKTDNNAVCHFFDQLKLASKQARWQELIAEFDFKFEHKARMNNQVADAMS